MIKAVIFDFDGVLHDTFDFHRENIKKHLGVDLSKDDFRELHNGNFFNHKLESLKNVDWDSYKDKIHTDLIDLKMDSSKKRTLSDLSENHILFVVSSGSSINIKRYLEMNDVIRLFSDIMGMEEFHSKIEKFNSILDNHNLKKEECIFITDTLGDILEANEVGIKTVAVDFGFHDRELLEKGNPEAIISDFNQILDFIE